MSKIFSKKASVIIAFAAFVFVVAELVFVAAPLQYLSPVYGLIATELILLVTAIIGSVVFRQRLSEVFSFKLPTLRQVFGVILLWICAFLIADTFIMILGCFMPDKILDTSSGISEFIADIPVWIRVLVVAVLPAVCEEAIHRGFILHFLKSMDRKWLVILIMGIQFGIFHLDGIRFIPTALLGGFITYIALKTDNILLCSLFHFINNLPSAFVSAEAADFTDIAVVSDGVSVALTPEAEAVIFDSMFIISSGSFLFLCAAAPWLILAGSRLIGEKGLKDVLINKKITACAIISLICILAGIALLGYGVFQMMMPYIDVGAGTLVPDEIKAFV